MKFLKIILKIENVLETIIAIVAIALITILFVPRVFNNTPYSILSGSMEPTIQTGSLTYVKNVPVETIQENDIIGFHLSDGTVTVHRVVEINKEEKICTTKGDANDNQDFAPISFDQIIGKVTYSIPYLGYFLLWTKSKSVLAVIAVVITMFIVTPILNVTLKKLDKERRE